MAQGPKAVEPDMPTRDEVTEQVLVLMAMQEQAATDASDTIYDNASKTDVSP